MKLALLTLLLASVASPSSVTWSYSSYSNHVFCGTGVNPAFTLMCPDTAQWKAGIFVFLSSDDPSVTRFHITASAAMKDGTIMTVETEVNKDLKDNTGQALLWFGKELADFTVARILVDGVAVIATTNQAYPVEGAAYGQ